MFQEWQPIIAQSFQNARAPQTTDRPLPVRLQGRGSKHHPKSYDPHIASIIAAAYHDIWDTIEDYDTLRMSGSDAEIKAAIIRMLLDLVSEGTTSREELKARALEGLPFG
jgi:hypothetical protein